MDLFCLLGSTKIPMVRATLFMDASHSNSSKLKPLLAHTVLRYLTVGHLSMDSMGLDTGHALAFWALHCWVPHVVVQPCDNAQLPDLVEVGLQDHAIVGLL